MCLHEKLCEIVYRKHSSRWGDFHYLELRDKVLNRGTKLVENEQVHELSCAREPSGTAVVSWCSIWLKCSPMSKVRICSLLVSF